MVKLLIFQLVNRELSITNSNGKYKNCRFCVVTKAKAFYLREQLTFAVVVPPLQSQEKFFYKSST